jgi:hypothetical protein
MATGDMLSRETAREEIVKHLNFGVDVVAG